MHTPTTIQDLLIQNGWHLVSEVSTLSWVKEHDCGAVYFHFKGREWWITWLDTTGNALKVHTDSVHEASRRLVNEGLFNESDLTMIMLSM